MSPTSPQPEPRKPREVPVSRRHLVTARGSQDAAPRVVLRLPDLDALAAVALGPAQPATRRRFDAAHHGDVADRSTKRTLPTLEPSETTTTTTTITTQSALTHLFRIPAGKLLPAWTVGGATVLGKTWVLLQQPKMALAAVMAIGLQLAAVLAMLTGGGNTASKSPTDDVLAAPSVVFPGPLQPAGPYDPIQTPATVFGRPAAPQPLPGFGPGELPAWPGDQPVPKVAGTAMPGEANRPAKLSSGGAPIPPPALGAPGAGGSYSGNLSTNQSRLTEATMSRLQSGDAQAERPKARLHGTIKKISTSGITQ